MRKLKITVIILSLMVLGALGYYMLMDKSPINYDDFTPEDINENVDVIDDNPMDTDLRQLWLESKAKNQDYIGQIVFDSGIIDLGFVQAEDIYDDYGNFYTFYDIDGNLITEDEKDYGCDGYACSGNDVYLWTYWETMQYDKFDNGGSVFLDYRNSLEDENLIIYGHHFSVEYNPERDRAFTCLENFVNEEYYEDNKYLSLILDNEIRKYEVAVVFRYDLNNGDNAQYYRTVYDYQIDGTPDEGYKEKYFDYINAIAYYNTGVTLDENDRTLTLQTCFSGEPDYREVLVCKEIDRIEYSGE